MSGVADFLSRWSRRKHAWAHAKQAEMGPAEPVAAEAAEATPLAPSDCGDAGAGSHSELSAEELEQLPRVEDLTAATDITPFLRDRVPKALRNAALRRMWSLDPSIREYVGDARDYAYDWNTPGGVPGSSPLLPTDDVKEMLRQVLVGLQEKQDAPAAPAGMTAPSEAGMAVGERLGQSSGAVADNIVDQQALSPEPDATSDATVVALPLDEGKVPAARSGESGTGQGRPATVRRHGGAAPI